MEAEGDGEAQRQVEDPNRAECGGESQTGWNKIGKWEVLHKIKSTISNDGRHVTADKKVSMRSEF